MEVELPSMPVSIRQNYQGRLAGSKAALDKVKKILVRCSFAFMGLAQMTNHRKTSAPNHNDQTS